MTPLIACLLHVLALPGSFPPADVPVAPVAPVAPVSAEAPAADALPSASAAPMIVLVRHAEKATDDPDDPSLTDAGMERAALLAELLGRSNVTAILSTDYRRTRFTAGPLAAAAGVDVEIYDPDRLQELAERLRSGAVAADGVIVVVGHSNTTPELVTLLGGDPGEPIADDEYDRLYVVHPAAGAEADASGAPTGEAPAAGTLILRFGQPWDGTDEGHGMR